MTRARQLADLISDGVIGTTELADDAITPVKLDETGNYTIAQLDVTGTVTADGLTVEGDATVSSANPRIRLFETDTTDLNTQLQNNGGEFVLKTLLDDASNSTTRIKVAHSTGDISFYADNGTTQGLFWDASSQNLGIGTTSPAVNLDIAEDSAGVDAIIGITAGTGGRAQIRSEAQSDGTSSELSFHTMSGSSTSERLRIDSSGKVGIGTSSPSTHLDVFGGIRSTASGGYNQITTTSIGDAVFNSNGNNWLTVKNGVPADAVRIDSSGKVGIGTSSPAYKLHSTTSDASDYAGYFHNSAGSGNGTALVARGGANNSGAGAFIVQDYNGNEDFKVDGLGRVTMPNQPVYSASDSRALSGSNSHLNSSNFYNHVYVNVGNHMNTSNGNFTCPVAGVYRIYFRATHYNNGCNVRLQKNGVTINEAYSGAVGSDYSVSSEAIVSCAANDTLRIQFHTIDIHGGHQHKQVTFQLLH